MHKTKLIMLRNYIILIFIYGIIDLAPFNAYSQTRELVGYVERARIYPGNLSLRAKIDTGAKTSSLNAPHISFFNRDNRQWVKFDVINKKGKQIQIEKEIFRSAKIKKHGILSFVSQKRPVIMLGICLGSVYKEVEVNLVDRSHYNYQLLIGRNFLIDSFLVDPSLTFYTKPKCESVINK